MILRRFGVRVGVIALGAALSACATSPLGRKQLLLMPESQMDVMGAQAFNETKKATPTEKDPSKNLYVQCITQALLEDPKEWEVVVFKDETANAFALPGKKIGVHTGIMEVAKTDAQLAAVIGHEIGHVRAQHGNERVSEAFAVEGGMVAIGALGAGNPHTDKAMALLGIGSQFGILLPHSRTQESEADTIGLHMMAQAGFDPRQAVQLWKNMSSAGGGGQPPEWLSTHPSHSTRIQALEAAMPKALEEYQEAQSKGHRPKCVL